MRIPRMHIAVILLNWNGKKDTLECLASLQNVRSPSFQPIVVDNGSTDDSVAIIRAAHPEIPILENGANLGFAGGNNPGIQWALSKGAEWILLLNNDTIVDPDFLHAFLQAAAEKPKAKILGAKIYNYHSPAVIDHLGGLSDQKSLNSFPPRKEKPTMAIPSKRCSRSIMCAERHSSCIGSVPETIGWLKPRVLFWEETDFCMRARRRGFEVWTAPKAKIWHKVSSSFVGGKPHMHYFWWRSRVLWLERNCPFSERRTLYRRVILPELRKALRHYILHSLRALLLRRSDAKQKALRCKAGLAGALHYWRGRFGNCPKWLLKKN